METLITDQNFKPDFVKDLELTANIREFSQLMPGKPCHSSRQSSQRPAYEPGKYATLPVHTIGEKLQPSSRETGKSNFDMCLVERSDLKHASHSSETQKKSPLLLTGSDGKPVLWDEYQKEGESVWNPRASMAFDNAKGLLNPLGENNCFLNSAVQV